MKKERFHWIFFPAVCGVILAVALGACSRGVDSLDENDFRDPLMRKAQSRIRQGDKDGAIRCLNKALERKPELAQANLELALLYDDYKKDYVRAIYHYERYIELRPTAQKRGLIEDLIRKAKMSFVASLSDQYSETSKKLQALEEENNRLKVTLRKVRENLARRACSADLFSPAAAGCANAGQAGPADRVKSDAGVRAAGLSADSPWRSSPRKAGIPAKPGVNPLSVEAGREISGNAQSPPSVVLDQALVSTSMTYCVQAGDTLSLIAAKVYNNPRKWRLIFDANSNTLSSPERLKSGQVLILPR